MSFILHFLAELALLTYSSLTLAAMLSLVVCDVLLNLLKPHWVSSLASPTRLILPCVRVSKVSFFIFFWLFALYVIGYVLFTLLLPEEVSPFVLLLVPLYSLAFLVCQILFWRQYGFWRWGVLAASTFCLTGLLAGLSMVMATQSVGLQIGVGIITGVLWFAMAYGTLLSWHLLRRRCA